MQPGDSQQQPGGVPVDVDDDGVPDQYMQPGERVTTGQHTMPDGTVWRDERVLVSGPAPAPPPVASMPGGYGYTHQQRGGQQWQTGTATGVHVTAGPVTARLSFWQSTRGVLTLVVLTLVVSVLGTLGIYVQVTEQPDGTLLITNETEGADTGAGAGGAVDTGDADDPAPASTPTHGALAEGIADLTGLPAATVLADPAFGTVVVTNEAGGWVVVGDQASAADVVAARALVEQLASTRPGELWTLRDLRGTDQTRSDPSPTPPEPPPGMVLVAESDWRIGQACRKLLQQWGPDSGVWLRLDREHTTARDRALRGE